MPLDELLAMYGYNGSGPPNPANEPLQESRSSSEEEILSNQDLTLDKDEIARDLHFLKDEENDNSTSVNDLMDSVNLKSNTARLLRCKWYRHAVNSIACRLVFKPRTPLKVGEAAYASHGAVRVVMSLLLSSS